MSLRLKYSNIGQYTHTHTHTHTHTVSLFSDPMMDRSAWTVPSAAILRAQAFSHCPSRFPWRCLCIQLGYAKSPSWESFSLQKLTLHISTLLYVLIFIFSPLRKILFPLIYSLTGVPLYNPQTLSSTCSILCQLNRVI